MIELIDYERVPVGFEIAIVDGKEVTVPLWNGGMFMGKEEDWDDEVRFINELQKGLRKLDENARVLRLQIIGNEQCNYKFFQNISKILEGIGRMYPRKDVLGHVPNVPDYLRPLEKDRLELGKAHLKILELWLQGKSASEVKNALPQYKRFVDPIYKALGERTPLKKLYVERVIISFSYPVLHWTEEVDLSKVDGRAVDEFGINHPRGLEIDKKIAKGVKLTYQDSNFGNKKQFGDEILAYIVYRGRGLCNHKFFRHLDIILKSIGKEEWRKDNPPRGKERAELAEKISHHVFALDSWLAEVKERKAIAENPNAREVIEKVYRSLGKRAHVKEWLAACLWKTMKNNKKYYKIINVDKDSIKSIPYLKRKYRI